ncbi:GntR family transcriptional regulator [Phytohabitans rumicis]|uniref:GntR family transcriptional regulator n=1 Tax=Phytohabitans rumicis TaxID=1076125 RepID=UPI001FEAE8EF|nr:GntR family transcriptional regulator [Phytohabitans rumicis]
MTTIRPARRLTLTEDVYVSVQGLIMDHAVAPGERINIDALARQMEVSPTPVREALARLEADGLVRKRPLAGYTAAPLLTLAEFEELVEMRLILEPAAARRVATAGADVDRLRAEADLPDQQPRIAAFTAQDARFHHLLAELSGNRMLHEAVVRLRSHLHLFRLNFPATHYGISAQEHHRVVDAIAAGDPDRAEAAMRAHISAARERHLVHLEGQPS